MRFRLTAIFYATAVIGAAIAAFGAWGIILGALVIFYWFSVFSSESPKGILKVGAWLCAAWACLVCCAGLPPMMGHVREPSRMMECTSNLRQIGTAIRNYHATYGTFPPAYLADEDERPMHSWRVLLLPSLEEISLYNQYDFSEPWDGPSNSRLVDKALHWYRCPSLAIGAPPQETSYVAIVGPGTMWQGAKPPDAQAVQDIGAQTLLIGAAPNTGVHWMEPRDLRVEEFLERHSAGGQGPAPYHDSFGDFFSYSSLWNGLFADGHTESFDASGSGADRTATRPTCAR